MTEASASSLLATPSPSLASRRLRALLAGPKVMIGGTVIIERIFAYPGIGNMAIEAVINRDLPLIQGLVLVFAVIFILINIAVDLLVALFNPKLRYA